MNRMTSVAAIAAALILGSQASTPAELQALIDADRARYGRIIREKGLKVE